MRARDVMSGRLSDEIPIDNRFDLGDILASTILDSLFCDANSCVLKFWAVRPFETQNYW